jgi:hypothetical protein
MVWRPFQAPSSRSAPARSFRCSLASIAWGRLGARHGFPLFRPAINVLAILLTARVLVWSLGTARTVGAVVFSVVIGFLMHLVFGGGTGEAVAAAAMPEPPRRDPCLRRRFHRVDGPHPGLRQLEPFPRVFPPVANDLRGEVGPDNPVLPRPIGSVGRLVWFPAFSHPGGARRHTSLGPVRSLEPHNHLRGRASRRRLCRGTDRGGRS